MSTKVLKAVGIVVLVCGGLVLCKWIADGIRQNERADAMAEVLLRKWAIEDAIQDECDRRHDR